MEVKLVPFMGAEIAAVRDEDGQIWAAVRWMCEGIGLSKGQTNGEITKIGTDEVLSDGNTKFRIPTNSGLQEALFLNLDYVPLWLAKIRVTPTMRRDSPELAAKLKEYQLKAKDVLAAAFLPQGRKMLEIPEDYPAALRALADTYEKNRALEQKIEEDAPAVAFARDAADSAGTTSIGDFAKVLFEEGFREIGRGRLFRLLREENILDAKNMPYQKYLDAGWFEVIEVSRSGRLFKQTRITGKGQQKLHQRLFSS